MTGENPDLLRQPPAPEVVAQDYYDAHGDFYVLRDRHSLWLDEVRSRYPEWFDSSERLLASIAACFVVIVLCGAVLFFS